MRGGGAVFGWVPLVADDGIASYKIHIFQRESEIARFGKLEYGEKQTFGGERLNGDPLQLGPNNLYQASLAPLPLHQLCSMLS